MRNATITKACVHGTCTVLARRFPYLHSTGTEVVNPLIQYSGLISFAPNYYNPTRLPCRMPANEQLYAPRLYFLVKNGQKDGQRMAYPTVANPIQFAYRQYPKYKAFITKSTISYGYQRNQSKFKETARFHMKKRYFRLENQQIANF